MAEILDLSVEKMGKTINALKDEFNTIRTGRASASIFDKVRVDYYGEKSPLSQVATVSLLLISSVPPHILHLKTAINYFLTNDF